MSVNNSQKVVNNLNNLTLRSPWPWSSSVSQMPPLNSIKSPKNQYFPNNYHHKLWNL